ncbi:uncharacterized protein LOC117512435 [Thalassophryne amazonica]|uniref:uncharacterized protein LOC117512435 n=1 Tax=Thalassophryne amazonica TaxID=390379 RepID=UPI001470EBE1|nr:uncharacterized protein LOC117512435 [Thalassophryne amazonica]XP_034028398.1 uncharacterized protein LOC117512435 [Thalassophryne amazonica]
MSAEMETMSYVSEARLSGGRGVWSSMPAPSSCPEVNLEDIDAYLQEHLQEVQPVHSSPSALCNMAPQVHAYSYHDTRIIENSWSGQHAYEWHCGSDTLSTDCEEQALPLAWASPHDNQWDHVPYSYETPIYIDSDSQSCGSHYQEYHYSPSPSSDSGSRKNKNMPLTPLLGKRKERLFQFLLRCSRHRLCGLHLVGPVFLRYIPVLFPK